MLLVEGADAADAGAKVHRHPLRGQGADDPALLHCLAGGGHAVLGIGVAARRTSVLSI